MKKYLLLVLALIFIPCDYILWNLIFRKKYGYRNLNIVIYENIRHWGKITKMFSIPKKDKI